MKSTKEKDKEQSKSKMSVCIFVFPVLFLLFSFFAPAIFTRNIPLLSYIPWVNEVCFNEKTGVIGDTFGIMNPFIAIAAAVITGLAFWEQYKANQQLKDDNAKQECHKPNGTTGFNGNKMFCIKAAASESRHNLGS